MHSEKVEKRNVNSPTEDPSVNNQSSFQSMHKLTLEKAYGIKRSSILLKRIATSDYEHL